MLSHDTFPFVSTCVVHVRCSVYIKLSLPVLNMRTMF
jgi:hypothetical protein